MIENNFRNIRKAHAYLQIMNITKRCLYNIDHLIPYFYIVKLGFTGVNIIFHISAQNVDCGYTLEPPNEYPQSILEQKCEKYQNFLSENFHYFVGKIFNIFE